MVSDESATLIANWVKRNNVTVPVAQVTGRSVIKSFGGTGYPSSYLVNASGVITWEGHPMEADDALIEGKLAGGPVTGPGSTPASEQSNWWVWMLVVFGLAFAGALGWFWWSTRDRIPAYLKPPGAGYQPPPGYAPSPQYAPQGPPGTYPGQPQYAPPGQPQYTPPGQPQYAPPGQPQYAPPGQPQYAPQGQPQYAPQGQYPAPQQGGYLQAGAQGVALPPVPELEEDVPDPNLITGGGHTRTLNQRAAPFQVSHETAPDVTRQFNTTRARGKGQHYMGDPPPQG